LSVGEVLGTVTQHPADLVERIVAVPTVADSVLLDAAPDFVEHLGAQRTTWNASSTATASGSSSRIALA
jgi:hypothetical protein